MTRAAVCFLGLWSCGLIGEVGRVKTVNVCACVKADGTQDYMWCVCV